MPRPTGEYAEQMLEPGGWPGADEIVFYDRAQEFTRILAGVTDVLDACRQQQSTIFDGAWSGGAARAADGELGSRIDYLRSLAEDIARVVDWHDQVAIAIEQAKIRVGDNVELAGRQIALLRNDPTLDTQERSTAINAVLLATHTANVGVVAGTAGQILATGAWQPPRNPLPDSAERRPPSVNTTLTAATQPVAAPPGAPSTDTGESDTPRPDAPPADPAVDAPVAPGSPQPGVDASTPAPDRAPQSPGGAPAAPMIPSTPSTPSPGLSSPSSSPSHPSPVGKPVAPAPAPGIGQPEARPAPAAAARPGAAGAGGGRGLAPASAASAPPLIAPPAAGVKDDVAPAVTPASATPGAAAAHPAGRVQPAPIRGAAAAGSGSGSGAPVGPRPMGAHPSSRATSGPTRHGPTSSPVPRSDPADRRTAPDPAVVAAVPVSTARAERDAVAAASAADAEGRGGGKPDPLRLARRIAAALNAPDSEGRNDLGFFWVTGVTADGSIVVANSYGLAYIPDGVQLPEQVQLATADASIAATERARWATYPVAAVQGWAECHGKTLRAVIGTQEQLANSDAGAAKVVLAPDDIPESGTMAGRSRLEVVDPESAQQLRDTADGGLGALLAPLPATAEPPSDRRSLLWFGVLKPMASNAHGREVAHLRAFRAYSAHSEEVALADAHRAVEPEARRSAIAEWLYWRYVARLLDGVVPAAA